LLHPVKQSPRFFFLCRRQMLPCLHAIEHALLLLRRQAVEMFQPLA
jgi:hypothetical protein